MYYADTMYMTSHVRAFMKEIKAEEESPLRRQLALAVVLKDHVTIYWAATQETFSADYSH